MNEQQYTQKYLNWTNEDDFNITTIQIINSSNKIVVNGVNWIKLPIVIDNEKIAIVDDDTKLIIIDNIELSTSNKFMNNINNYIELQNTIYNNFKPTEKEEIKTRSIDLLPKQYMHAFGDDYVLKTTNVKCHTC